MSTAAAEKADDKSVLVVDQPYSRREALPAPVPQPQPNNLMQALAVAAADPRMDVAKVEKLWAMHKELQDREAAQAFADAMARAQSNVRPIIKDRENSHTKSWYATLAAIVDQVTPIITAEGLSISFDTFDPTRDKDLPALEKGMVRVIAIVSHRGGHTRKYHLDGALDDAGKDGTKNKTGIQAMGSTVSYLRRYLVCMIVNVATANEDDDGNGGGNGQKMPEKAFADHLAAIDAASDEPELLRCFGKAWNAAESLKDKNSQQQFIEHRDLRRKALKAPRR